MGKEQQRRLMELLGKLAAREAGVPIRDATTLMFGVFEFHGQEHTDAITLTTWVGFALAGDSGMLPTRGQPRAYTPST